MTYKASERKSTKPKKKKKMVTCPGCGKKFSTGGTIGGAVGGSAGGGGG